MFKDTKLRQVGKGVSKAPFGPPLQKKIYVTSFIDNLEWKWTISEGKKILQPLPLISA